MRTEELLETLSTIPIVGPLLQGSALAVAVKLLVLVATVVTMVAVLKAAQRRLVAARQREEARRRPRRVAQVTPLPSEIEWQEPPASRANDAGAAAGVAREGHRARASAAVDPPARPAPIAPGPAAPVARSSWPQPRASAPPPNADLSIDSPIDRADELVSTTEDTVRDDDASRASEPFSKSEAPLPRAPTDVRQLEARFGTEVNRRYELLEELGRGGMAEVYKARDRALNRIIALKFLSPNLVGDTSAMRLFAREARAAAALNHPAIVTIYDLGVIESRPFISMEFIEGTDLRALLAEKRTLQLALGVDLGIRLADALDYAHEHHVIHRDIKPANVIVTPGARDGAGRGVKLLDFGVAKALQGRKGAASMLAGTPQYMAPEQLSQGEIDGRADLFSLGVLLYRALTGKRPFHGLERQPDVKPLFVHAPWVPAELDQVVRRAIALDPDERYQRGRDMAAALAASLKNVADIDDGPTVFDPNHAR